MSPRFSVLVPTFDSETFIENAIDSVLEQTVAAEADVEIVVVDDGSRDSTVSLVSRYGPPVKLLVQRRRGTAAARNLALYESVGDAVVLLDHDDELHPRFLEEVGAALDSDPSLGAVFTDAWLYDDLRGEILPSTFLDRWPLPASPDLIALVRSNWVGPRAAIRRTAALEVGGFDEDLSGVDDYDLWICLLTAGHPIGVIREPLAFYRLRPGSQGTDRLATAELNARMLKKALRSGLPPDAATEARIRLAAWRERASLARAGRAVENRAWNDAIRAFAAGWKVSPLRWRLLRIALVAGEGLIRRRRRIEERQPLVRRAAAMRSVPLPKRRPSPIGVTMLRVRRTIATHAVPRRSSRG